MSSIAACNSAVLFEPTSAPIWEGLSGFVFTRPKPSVQSSVSGLGIVILLAAYVRHHPHPAGLYCDTALLSGHEPSAYASMSGDRSSSVCSVPGSMLGAPCWLSREMSVHLW